MYVVYIPDSQASPFEVFKFLCAYTCTSSMPLSRLFTHRSVHYIDYPIVSYLDVDCDMGVRKIIDYHSFPLALFPVSTGSFFFAC